MDDGTAYRFLEPGMHNEAAPLSQHPHTSLLRDSRRVSFGSLKAIKQSPENIRILLHSEFQKEKKFKPIDFTAGGRKILLKTMSPRLGPESAKRKLFFLTSD